jgi:hypothetical protein
MRSRVVDVTALIVDGGYVLHNAPIEDVGKLHGSVIPGSTARTITLGSRP